MTVALIALCVLLALVIALAAYAVYLSAVAAAWGRAAASARAVERAWEAVRPRPPSA